MVSETILRCIPVMSSNECYDSFQIINAKSIESIWNSIDKTIKKILNDHFTRILKEVKIFLQIKLAFVYSYSREKIFSVNMNLISHMRTQIMLP